MVASVLTVVNVLLGIWAGRMWRFTHYNWGFVKLFAYAQAALCAAIALVWNDVAGHVRDVYVFAEKSGALEAPDEAFATAWRTMIERPLPWESLPSAGLALVGIAVFLLTTYKSYTADDTFPGYGARHRNVESLRGRYQDDLNDALEELESIAVFLLTTYKSYTADDTFPGYGARHRNVEALRARYQDELNDALEELESTRNEANVAIEEIKNRYQMDQAGWESTLDKLRMIVEDYAVNLRQYNNDLAYLLAAYRSANLAARSASPPPFFDIEADDR